ncbi:RtcB family protein [Desulfobacula sp.]|uniref:RtcB family protein n=1 Tax=Desulfobacula sp. TaxID=2593537 RepID=UPI0026222D3A|nr:RtcB family protein [Desulfobacula sp.]
MSLKKIDDFRWLLPRTGSMRVPGIIYTSESGLGDINKDAAFKQVCNVACLPGIIKASMAMPDFHGGYGFPIGGVAAFDWETGIVSPGGVGYDINCGVRLARTFLEEKEVRPHLRRLISALFREIPSGIGSTGSLNLSYSDEKKVLKKGSLWAVQQGFGQASDIEHTEEGGCMPGADPKDLSKRALERGKKQLGTLGSGNHFLEVGVVEKIFEPKAAKAYGLFQGQVTVMLHTGSRGLGYQVCDDHLAMMTQQVNKRGLTLPDRQLAWARIQSGPGQHYLSAMACAANYAWANRQILMHRASLVFMDVLGISPGNLGMSLVYDLCHNIAKKESHTIDGKTQTVCVHRKGATRSFGPGHPSLCPEYRKVGQPILIPGDMGTASYVLAGTQRAMDETFGSTCHGAGRVMSRMAARKASQGRSIQQELEDRGILVKWTGRSTLAEEMPDAYKDISQVVDIVHGAGLSKIVARLRPLAVVKG